MLKRVYVRYRVTNAKAAQTAKKASFLRLLYNSGAGMIATT